MNKTVVSILFMIAATIFNLLLMVVIFFTIYIVASKLYGGGETRDLWPILTYMFALLVSIVGALYIYNKIIKWGRNKWDLDEKILGKKLKDY